MIEALDVRELPYVEDGHLDVVRQLGEQVEAFFDGDLPGVGIVHTADSFPPHKSVHQWHRGLVLRAVSLLEGGVGPRSFSPIRYPLDMKGCTPAHTDDFGDRLLDTDMNSLQMRARLHTASPQKGAQVTLANTAPGYYSNHGDTEIFGIWGGDLRKAIADSRGYDVMPHFLPPAHLAIEQIQERRNSQITDVNEPVIYRFDQLPLSSVLFRAGAHMGPVTIHEFEDAPESGAGPRMVFMSDLTIQSVGS